MKLEGLEIERTKRVENCISELDSFGKVKIKGYHSGRSLKTDTLSL